MPPTHLSEMDGGNLSRDQEVDQSDDEPVTDTEGDRKELLPDTETNVKKYLPDVSNPQVNPEIWCFKS